MACASFIPRIRARSGSDIRNPSSKLGLLLDAGLRGYYIGKAAREALHPGVRLVLSNSTVGWYRFDKSVKHAHFFHGTYRGQAEAIRPYIKYRGYLRMKWWDAMVLERYSGKNNIALCARSRFARKSGAISGTTRM